jgi:hypothetical protein
MQRQHAPGPIQPGGRLHPRTIMAPQATAFAMPDQVCASEPTKK